MSEIDSTRREARCPGCGSLVQEDVAVVVQTVIDLLNDRIHELERRDVRQVERIRYLEDAKIKAETELGKAVEELTIYRRWFTTGPGRGAPRPYIGDHS